MLTPADEFFYHQIPEPLMHVAVHHEHWRESYYYGLHPPDGRGDFLMLTMAHYPKRQALDSHQFTRIDAQRTFAHFTRPYDGDPHTTVVGPVSVEIIEPYRKLRLVVEPGDAPVALDLTFTARTLPYALRRGTMKAGHEIIWDQSHFLQSGIFNGSYTHGGVTRSVNTWWGQRDHSWGIRDHGRCPMWIWFSMQFEDGMYGVWHWEYPNGARVFTDGCYAPVGGGDPIPIVDFRHDMRWTDAQGSPTAYGRDGAHVEGLAGSVEITLEGGRTVRIDSEGVRSASYGPYGGGQHLMRLRTDDGRTGSGIYELTGVSHHRYFPVARGERLPPG